MQAEKQSKIAIVDWTILLGALAISVAVSEFLSLPYEWQDSAVYTVVVFTAVILSLRPAWHRAGFWKILALVFTAHIVLVAIAVPGLPHGRFGFPKLLLVPIGASEGILIVTLIWRRVKAPRTPNAKRHNGRIGHIL